MSDDATAPRHDATAPGGSARPGRPLEASAGTRVVDGDAFPLVFERSRPGRHAYSLPDVSVPAPPVEELVPERFRRTRAPRLPEISELDLVRHYTRLAQRNWAIDVGPYPLGSCTMKYNPKVAEDAAALPGFARLHPAADDDLVQGALELLGALERALCEATGMARLTFQPAAGAQGELTGLLIMRAWHAARGDARKRVIIPDSAHGTNPASVTLAGYRAEEVRSDERGLVDLAALEAALDDDVAGLMLTNPNTLGLFERDIERMAGAVHDAGGLLYYDGANFNSIVGVARPGDMGFDIVHLNLHKTFATPHGGGGPGSGPLAVAEHLERFLPAPVLVHDDAAGRWRWDHDRPDSIGRIHSFHGNFGINVRAYAYLRSNGPEGLRRIAERAVLNANYLRTLVADAFPAAYEGTCMHEFVATAKPLKRHGVRAMDVAKRLIDLGFHPPTVYFPLVVEEALMVEPTETESKETIDGLADALVRIAREAEEDPDSLHDAPVTTPVRRPDEARAARHLKVRWTPE
ncbi:MAG TPA: aminomethyl-transferring glycine dehydrogenase subunit GcvPB [Actinomycetota bacterium]|nr:aminomethyl-transferring glycine dehydrogenase subunit GcvPB [Actinomycetota bacterium]